LTGGGWSVIATGTKSIAVGSNGSLVELKTNGNLFSLLAGTLTRLPLNTSTTSPFALAADGRAVYRLTGAVRLRNPALLNPLSPPTALATSVQSLTMSFGYLVTANLSGGGRRIFYV